MPLNGDHMPPVRLVSVWPLQCSATAVQPSSNRSIILYKEESNIFLGSGHLADARWQVGPTVVHPIGNEAQAVDHHSWLKTNPPHTCSQDLIYIFFFLNADHSPRLAVAWYCKMGS